MKSEVAFGICFVCMLIFFAGIIYFVFVYNNSVEEFCKDAGYDFYEQWGPVQSCVKRNQGELVGTQIRCTAEPLSLLTFGNPLKGCKIYREVVSNA